MTRFLKINYFRFIPPQKKKKKKEINKFITGHTVLQESGESQFSTAVDFKHDA